jgi:hypothetical protein
MLYPQQPTSYQGCIVVAETWPTLVSICKISAFPSIQVWLCASSKSSSLLGYLTGINGTLTWNSFTAISSLLLHLIASMLLLAQGSFALHSGVNSCFFFSVPVWDTQQCLDPNGYLPKEDPLAIIICPSVFVKSKQVTRRLSGKELAAIYNVPHEVLHKFY